MSNRKRIKLSEFAEQNGIAYITAYRHWGKGNIEGIQLPGGSILVEGWKDTTVSADENKNAIVYVRVSQNSNKQELTAQRERLLEYAKREGYLVLEVVEDVAYSFSDNRMKLMNVFYREDWDVLIVEDKHSFMKFGLPYIEALLRKTGQKIVAYNTYTDEHEINPDVSVNGEKELAGLVQKVTQLMKTLIGVGGQKAAIESAIREFMR